MTNDEILQAPNVTDTQRLDWVINHPDAEFDVDNKRLSLCCYITAYLPNDEEQTKGVAGRFIARGDSHRDCIDAFLRGDVKRID